MDICIHAGKLAVHCKKDFYSNKIEEAGRDQKQLYRQVNKLMGVTGFLPSRLMSAFRKFYGRYNDLIYITNFH
jgi:hypothetical protein